MNHIIFMKEMNVTENCKTSDLHIRMRKILRVNKGSFLVLKQVTTWREQAYPKASY